MLNIDTPASRELSAESTARSAMRRARPRITMAQILATGSRPPGGFTHPSARGRATRLSGASGGARLLRAGGEGGGLRVQYGDGQPREIVEERAGPAVDVVLAHEQLHPAH